MPYQVIDWDAHYENAKSRSIRHPSWCAIPNKQDGLAYRRMVREFPQHYAVFVGVVLALSKQDGSTRNGWLTDTGKPDGIAWDADDIQDKTGISSGLIGDALAYLCSDRIKWMHNVEADVIQPRKPLGA